VPIETGHCCFIWFSSDPAAFVPIETGHCSFIWFSSDPAAFVPIEISEQCYSEWNRSKYSLPSAAMNFSLEVITTVFSSLDFFSPFFIMLVEGRAWCKR